LLPISEPSFAALICANVCQAVLAKRSLNLSPEFINFLIFLCQHCFQALDMTTQSSSLRKRNSQKMSLKANIVTINSILNLPCACKNRIPTNLYQLQVFSPTTLSNDDLSPTRLACSSSVGVHLPAAKLSSWTPWLLSERYP
jgi:hypothetical protein